VLSGHVAAAPNESIASQAVEDVTGCRATSVRRFTTGNHHYVYDVFLEDGQNIVIRMTTPDERESMEGALTWNHRLRGLGLPLPAIYFSNLSADFPFLVMERIPGRDLGFEIHQIKDDALRSLAKQLMGFQKTVGGLPTAGKFGYAAEPERASANTWTEVLAKSIDRSRKRIEAVGFVDVRCFSKLEELLSGCHDQLGSVGARPFLHDITTKNVIIADGKLTGIVDVDSLCYGDPLFQVALTKMALLSDGSNTRYIGFLLNELGPHSEDLFRLYTVERCIGFLSELGQPFNGNIVAATVERKDHLESILNAL